MIACAVSLNFLLIAEAWLTVSWNSRIVSCVCDCRVSSAPALPFAPAP